MNRRFPFAVLALVTLAAAGGCQPPRFQGPQIQNPPVGFFLQDESYLTRRMFPDREITFHTAWVDVDVSGVSVIYVNGHPGSLTLEDVMAAREGVWNATTAPGAIFEDLEAITIDGREGWGWYEQIHVEGRGLREVAYRAVVPYDTVTYAIEITSGDPVIKQYAPDTLRTLVSNFGIGRTTWNLPLIAVLVGGSLLLVNVLRTRARERATRLRSINFVTIKKDDEKKDDEGEVDTGPVAEDAPSEPPSIPPSPQ